MINSRVTRTGDGSHRSLKEIVKNKKSLNQYEEIHDSNHFWGFGDKEMTAEDMKKITIIRKFHGWNIANQPVIKLFYFTFYYYSLS